LAWIGSSVAFYVDDDPLWDELKKVKEERELSQLFEANLHRLPVALVVDVSSGLRLTAFLAGLRATIDQIAPGMTEWESLTYHDQPYVKVGPSPRARRDAGIDPSIYYAASGDSLIVTPSETTLQRALDRRAAREKLLAEGKPIAAANPPWLGSSLCLHMSPKVPVVFPDGFVREYQSQMQQQAWANLPILNEWKRRYPQEDPVKLHERFWQARLESPAGGTYVWNDAWQTMASTIYGHPGEPKPGPDVLPMLEKLGAVNLGVSFEEQGLRARAVLKRTK
jgi:hypothetical protein